MFESILFSEPGQSPEPDCFRDLHLDLILDPIRQAETAMDLSPLFYTPLAQEAQVLLRQALQKDLLKQDNLQIFDAFTGEILRLAEEEAREEEDLKSGDPWRCHLLLYGRILRTGEQYTSAVADLCSRIPAMDLTSAGLTQAVQALLALKDSPRFQDLGKRQSSLREKFSREQYCLQIRYDTVRVKKYQGEQNLSRQIQQVFEKFRQEDLRDYRQELKEVPYADHVEAALLKCLSRLYPELFSELSDYVNSYAHFSDPGLIRFCRELRFYIDWLLFLRELGLPFCFPEFSREDWSCSRLYDLALARKNPKEIVTNSFSLKPGEKILVVTGKNQGGKTTFARALGQIHYLASLGLCVPGSAARLPLTDRVLTHFEQEETPEKGRLLSDLQRLRDLLAQATDRSLLICNEIFASTTAEDARILGRRMLDRLLALGCRGLLVTFLTELAEGNPQVVSMVSAGDVPFRILRKPPEGKTCAMTLAQSHGLTYEQLKRRGNP